MYKVGIIGVGFVGSALAELFKDNKNIDLKLYDKYKKIGKFDDMLDREVVFLCLPTLMKNWEDRNYDYQAIIDTLADLPERVLPVIRSTVQIGTTKMLQKAFNRPIVFNPEFLREQTAVEDVKTADYVILGGKKKYCQKVAKIYQQVYCHDVRYLLTTSKTAEMVKIFKNSYLASKVALFNAAYDICQEYHIDYYTFRELIGVDPRIGISHTLVTDERGFGGHCLAVGTKINTPNGFMNIEDIKINDEIMDKKDTTIVTSIHHRTVDKSIKITAMGREIVGSLDHIHMIYENGQLKQKLLKDININDKVFIPQYNDVYDNTYIEMGIKPNGYIKWWPEYIEIDKKWGYIIGLYLSEGCSVKNQYSTIWTFGYEYEYLADKLVSLLSEKGLHATKNYTESIGTYGLSKCYRVRCRSYGLKILLEKLGLGTNAHNKNCPIFPNDVSKSIVAGWLDGDGSYPNNTITGFSRSKNLIKSLDRMLLNNGICASIGQNGQELRISCRDDVSEICKWSNRFKYKNDYIRKNSYKYPTKTKIEGGWAVTINKVELCGKKDVISIETQSHTYIAENILTHNCFVKDLNALIEQVNGPAKELLIAVWNYNTKVRKEFDGKTIGECLYPLIQTTGNVKRKYRIPPTHT